MSSHGSATLRIELPERLLADALAAAVWFALALTVTLSIGGPGGHLFASAAVMLMGAIGAFVAWAGGGPFRRARTIVLTPEGSLLVSDKDGRILEHVEPVGHRVIGGTVFLGWRFPARRYRPGAGVWLTPRDVRPADLRRLAVGLRCASRLEM